MGNVNPSSLIEITGIGSNDVRNSLLQLIEKKEWDKFEACMRENPTIALSPEPVTGRLPLHIAIIKNLPIRCVVVLLSINTSTACIIDSSGETPLHLAIANKSEERILQLLIRKAPSCLEIPNALGVLPLHIMLEYRIKYDIICECLNAFPAAAKHRAQDGKLPLHSACEHQATIEVIQLLLEYYSTAIMEMYNRRLPIHYACEHKTQVDVLRALHKSQPNCVGTKGIDGKYPLHLAVQCRCSVEVVETLVTLYPDALTHRDRTGSLPLHYALERKASDKIVQCLVTHRPETSSIRGKGAPGNFPLSIAIDRHYSSDIVRLLLQAYPAAAGEASMLRSLPLQACLAHRVTDTQLLIDILTAHSPAATALDEHDRTVLHYAVSHCLDVAFIKAILETAPNTASAEDKNGQIPLQLAVIRNNKEFITLLLLYHPMGAIHTDKYGMNALNYAIENNLEIQQIKEIIQANAQAAQNVIIKKRSVLHHAIEYKRNTEIIDAIVTAYPEACTMQEEVLGRLPLHWAIERLLPLPTLLCIDQACPVQGAHISDNRGWRSIHYAIHYPTPTELVQRILLAHPTIAQAKSDTLHLQYYTQKRTENPDFYCPVASETEVFLLLHYAVEHDALAETVAEIVMLTMPYTTTGQLHANHCDTWPYITSHTGDRYWRAVDIVLARYEHIQGLLNKLAEFRDAKMQQCIATATPRCLHEIIRRLFYYSCYDMHKQRHIHKSRHTLLHAAVYHSSSNHSSITKNPAYLDNLCLPSNHCSNSNSASSSTATTTTTAVVLKFTNYRSKFIREVIVRTNNTLNPYYILPLLASHNAQEDAKYRDEIKLKNYEKYPFLLVTKQGDCDLSTIVKHEHLEETDLSVIVEYIRQILQAVQHLHDEIGVVHGDIKPSNIIRDEGRLKLSNFGAATRHTDRELVTAELQQLAYAAPELALLQSHVDMCNAYSSGTEQKQHYNQHTQTADAGVGNSNSSSINNNATAVIDTVSQDMTSQHSQRNTTSDNMTYSNDLQATPDHANNRILSSPSQDMWAVGCILYLLLTSETVFLHTASEDLDADQLQLLCEWPDFVKQRRLDKIEDASARCLLSQLLSKDPKHRPTAAMCLQHPFCLPTAPAVRYVNMPAVYDVYISYKHDKKAQITQENTELCSKSKTDVKARKLSAMQRMFGSINLSDTDSLADEASLQSCAEEQEEENNSVVSSAEQVQEGYSTTTTEGRVAMLQGYFHSVNITCAESQHCSLKSTPISTNTEESVSQRETADWLGSRESLITQCSMAIILLTKETWLALEWCSARYKQQNAAATQEQRRQAGLTSIRKTFSTGLAMQNTDNSESSAEEIEKQQLLDDFLFEIRLIFELQTIGLFENGVYVFAAGEPLPVHNNIEHNNQNSKDNTGNEAHADEGRVLSEYYSQYMGEMVGRFGGSHPTAAAPTFPMHSIEAQLTQFLRDTGYSIASQHTDLTLYELFRYLVRLPTFHIVGPERHAFLSAVNSAAALITGTAQIDPFPATATSRDVISRPNTGAYKMLRDSHIATPRLHSPNPAAPSVGFGILGIPDMPIGGTVSRSGSRAGSRGRLRSRGLHSSSSSGRALRLTPLSPAHSVQQLATSRQHSPNTRSPVSGLPVHAFTPKSRTTSTSHHLGYTDMTAAQSKAHLAVPVSRGTQLSRRCTPLLAPLSRHHSPATATTATMPDPFLCSPVAAGKTNIPIRPWSAGECTADPCNKSFRNTTNFSINALQPEEFDSVPENNIAFYNDMDVITTPYFTELIAEDRVRTAHSLQYMSNKLEVSENEIANLHDELALLREQMHRKDAELLQLRTIVSVNSNQTIKSLPNKRSK